jgi:L-ribulose-5-phosphate 3-epimerase
LLERRIADMEIGVIQGFVPGRKNLKWVKDFGLNTCQLSCWDPAFATPENAQQVIDEVTSTGVRVCAVFGGWVGPTEWDFTRGPVTLGCIVPEEYRAMRMEGLKRQVDFAKLIGAPAVFTHCGFIPENMTDPAYPGVVDAIREITSYCADRGLEFRLETGQETPVVLLRTIERVAMSNLGLNLDPANLLLYGKGNPIDALDVFGEYVRNVHVKDGFCPTDGDHLGKEAPVGQGLVRFPEFIAKLKRIGFDGELIIEREISGEEQSRDIRKTIDDLIAWWDAA